MPSRDTEFIHQIVQDTNLYLDDIQRQELLWADVEGHIAASHIAESVGDPFLVSCNLQAAARLLAEISLTYNVHPSTEKQRRFSVRKSYHRLRVSRERSRFVSRA